MDKALVRQIVDRLFLPWDEVDLSVDGHKVHARVSPVSKNRMKCGVVVFVDGECRAGELTPDSEIWKKFYPLREKQLTSKSIYQAHCRIYGKREADRMRKETVYKYLEPYFRDGRAFALHLKKHCESVEVV